MFHMLPREYKKSECPVLNFDLPTVEVFKSFLFTVSMGLLALAESTICHMQRATKYIDSFTFYFGRIYQRFAK